MKLDVRNFRKNAIDEFKKLKNKVSDDDIKRLTKEVNNVSLHLSSYFPHNISLSFLFRLIIPLKIVSIKSSNYSKQKRKRFHLLINGLDSFSCALIYLSRVDRCIQSIVFSFFPSLGEGCISFDNKNLDIIRLQFNLF